MNMSIEGPRPEYFGIKSCKATQYWYLSQNVCILTTLMSPRLLILWWRAAETHISPYFEDLPGLFFGVWRCCDDQQSVQHVYRNAMGTLVVGASDSVGEEPIDGAQRKALQYSTWSQVYLCECARTWWCLDWWPWWGQGRDRSLRLGLGRRSTRCLACGLHL